MIAGRMPFRPHASRADSAEIRAALREEVAPLLVRRMRAGIWLLIAALVLFAIEALAIYRADRNPLFIVKAVQLATLLWAFWALARRPPQWLRSVYIALVVLCEVCVTTVISSIITADPLSALLLFIVLTMGTAMLLPWGVWPQLVTVAVASVMVAVNMIWVPSPQSGVESAAVATMLAFLTSVYASYALDRARLARGIAESGERASTAWRGAVIEAALDCIITIDPEGKILEFNPAAERTFGYRRADVLGAEMAEVVIPPALRDAHRQGLAHYQATGASSMLGRRIDTTAMRADGSKFPVELAIARVPQPGPAIFIGYVRDLTSLAQEARISGALVRVGTEMMSLLETARILDRLCVLTADVLGCDCSDSFLWEPRDDVYVWTSGHARAPEAAKARAGTRVARTALAPLLTRMQRDEPLAVVRGSSASVETQALLHDGVSSALHMALCQGDQIVGVHTAAYHGRTEPFTPQELRIARGIAQTASMALNNARLVEEVEHANHVKSEFLSTMSHELRTPLEALLGYAEILEEGDMGAAEHQHCVQRIRAVGTDLLELIESTLEISCAEAGRDELRLEAVRLRPFWEALAGQYAKMPRHAQVQFDWNSEVPDVVILTDPHKLSVVLRNLISNAVKFTERGVVRLTARLGGDELTFSVSDTGIGIPSDERNTIFEMFRQGSATEARRRGGAGLGLYIVRRFVEQLGGTVDVQSTPGGGSTFAVTLPRHQVGTSIDLAYAPAARS